MDNLIEHLERNLAENEEKCTEMRNELLRMESYIWGLKSSLAITRSLVAMKERGHRERCIKAEAFNEAG